MPSRVCQNTHFLIVYIAARLTRSRPMAFGLLMIPTSRVKFFWQMLMGGLRRACFDRLEVTIDWVADRRLG